MGTIAACIAAAGTLFTAKAVRDQTYKQGQAQQASSLYKELPPVRKCLADILHFYQTKQKETDRAKQDEDNSEELTKPEAPDRETIALDWARERKSKTPSEEVRAIDDCRRITTTFFEHAYMLLDKRFVQKDVFPETFFSWYTKSFGRLVRPLDKAILDVVNVDESHMPEIYKRIDVEQARDD